MSIPIVAVILIIIMSSDKPFLHFVIDPDLLKRLDDFRFKHRFESRAAAIKWLLEWAMRQKPAPDLKAD